MSSKNSYSYTVLRYVHDIATGEFLNVGVALFSPERRFVNAMCRTNFARLKAVFPSLDGDSFRASMRHVMACFERFDAEVNEQLALRSASGTVMDFALAVLARDDSSLQWSDAGAGVASDPEAMLSKLFERFVTSHDTKAPTFRKDDDDVWRHFSNALQQRQVLRHFDRKTIAVKDDEVEFKHAWKNGEWHCLAPLSFDLANADSIRDKAHRWLGQATSVAHAPEQFRLYFLVAEPTHSELRPAFESALSILRKAPVKKEFFSEAQALEFSERLASEVAKHDVHAIDDR